MDEDTKTSSSDFLLGCAAVIVCGSDGDYPLAGRTPEERHRWRFQMGVYFLAFLVFIVALDFVTDWIFGL